MTNHRKTWKYSTEQLLKMETYSHYFFHILSFSGKSVLQNFLLISTISLFLLKVVQRWAGFWSKSLEEDPYKAYKALRGPRTLSPTGNVLWFILKNDLLQKFVDYALKYGPIYRLDFFFEEVICLTSPEATQALLSSQNYGHYRHGQLQELMWPENIDSLLVLPGGEKWKSRRKLLSSPFKYKALQVHNPCFHKHANRLVQQLETRFKDGAGSEGILSDLLTVCTFGISSETLLGVDLDETEVGAGTLFCKNVNIFYKNVIGRCTRPWLLIPWIWKRSSAYQETTEAIASMRRIAGKVIEKYKHKMENDSRTDSEPNDTMIEVMLRKGADEKLIFDEVTIMLTVANDTTPISTEYALFILALHPEHQERCRQEIDKVFNDPNMFKDGVLKFEALTELKYLERCIQETLRMNPIVMIMRRLEAPLRINEELMGFPCSYRPIAVHNQPQYYPDPEKFDPDRFLPEKVRERSVYGYIPFSVGQRSCIGMKLAILELKIMIATILRNFEVRTPERREDVKLVVVGITKPSKPIRFILTRRNI
ncbi:Cytochrome P450 4C1 [Orchesella cincta]|uniref:Cytochrome P450 4C1 n=1 Tax=Orchesella cincta TaxID=48709 RepID=A0A1D2ML34_ORCCI|nr:Cytochrome P450 4C1 [Orchesella cincta]